MSSSAPDQKVRANAFAQARRVRVKGLAPILTLNHLSVLSGVPYLTLRRLVTRGAARPYRTFKMRKHSGGFRLISVPMRPLRVVQQWLARFVLAPSGDLHRFDAYAKGCSPYRIAQAHAGARWLVKIDVRRFFESISERQVFHAFRALGYEPLISLELARLCTMVPWSTIELRGFVRPIMRGGWRNRSRRWRNLRLGCASKTAQSDGDAELRSDAPNYRFTQVGYLPQGASTSPMLSNLVCVALDARLREISSSFGLTYSRYADDMIFSTAEPRFRRESAHQLIREVGAALQCFGFYLHTNKVVVAPPGARKVVLGLLVDGESPRLTREYRKRIESDVYGVEKFGLESHASKRGWRSAAAFVEHLKGRLVYCRTVDRAFAEKLGARWADALSASQFVAPFLGSIDG